MDPITIGIALGKITGSIKSAQIEKELQSKNADALPKWEKSIARANTDINNIQNISDPELLWLLGFSIEPDIPNTVYQLVILEIGRRIYQDATKRKTFYNNIANNTTGDGKGLGILVGHIFDPNKYSFDGTLYKVTPGGPIPFTPYQNFPGGNAPNILGDINNAVNQWGAQSAGQAAPVMPGTQSIAQLSGPGLNLGVVKLKAGDTTKKTPVSAQVVKDQSKTVAPADQTKETAPQQTFVQKNKYSLIVLTAIVLGLVVYAIAGHKKQ